MQALTHKPTNLKKSIENGHTQSTVHLIQGCQIIMNHATLDIVMYRLPQANLHAMALIGTYKVIVILQQTGSS